MSRRTLLILAICAAAIPLGIWLRWSIWQECRDSGHSVLYCIQLAGAR